MITRWPDRASSAAAVLPAGPPPITATSQFSMLIACKPKAAHSVAPDMQSSAPLGARHAALGGIDAAYRVHGVGLRGILVGAIALHSSESERETPRITAARLQVAESHFHDQLRLEVDGRAVAMRLALEELSGLPLEHYIGETLEGLAEHDVLPARRIKGAEMQIGELAAATAMTPLGGEDHQVQCVRSLDLEPACAAIAGLVWRIERFRHQPFVPGGERRVVELTRCGFCRGDASWDQCGCGNGTDERLDALPRRTVGNALPLDPQTVEKKRLERQAAAQGFDIEPASHSAHGDLERVWSSCGIDRNCLAVDDQRLRRQGARE